MNGTLRLGIINCPDELVIAGVKQEDADRLELRWQNLLIADGKGYHSDRFYTLGDPKGERTTIDLACVAYMQWEYDLA